MKGIAGSFVVLLVTIVIIIVILIPANFLTKPVTQTIKYEQDYSNVQMVLISLLSSTKNEKSIQQLIGEHLILGEPEKETLKQILKEKLDKLVETECYKLSTSSEDLIKSSRIGCDPKKYTKEIEIVLPYNTKKLTEKLILVID